MMTITEKVSYLKGLCEGVGISDETKEGRIIKAMIDVLDDMALTISDMEDGFAEVCEQVDAIDEDLGSLEEGMKAEAAAADSDSAAETGETANE